MKKILRSGYVDKTKNSINRLNFQWYITNQCNSKCHYCSFYKKENTDLSIDQNINIVP